jgi:hypothetical protein
MGPCKDYLATIKAKKDLGVKISSEEFQQLKTCMREQLQIISNKLKNGEEKCSYLVEDVNESNKKSVTSEFQKCMEES